MEEYGLDGLAASAELVLAGLGPLADGLARLAVQAAGAVTLDAMELLVIEQGRDLLRGLVQLGLDAQAEREVRLAEVSGRPVLHNTIQVRDENPAFHGDKLRWLEACNRRGLRVFGPRDAADLDEHHLPVPARRSGSTPAPGAPYSWRSPSSALPGSASVMNRSPTRNAW